jgi:hypothetical protein
MPSSRTMQQRDRSYPIPTSPKVRLQRGDLDRDSSYNQDGDPDNRALA